jgi:hypothetical protein
MGPGQDTGTSIFARFGIMLYRFRAVSARTSFASGNIA